jgi:hypothetical protein
MVTLMPTNAAIVDFAAKLMQLIHEANTTTTYKYALLLALIELSQENVGRFDGPAGSVTSAQVARRVIELYWPHTRVNPIRGKRLRQLNRDEKSIVDLVADFQARLGNPRSISQAHSLEPICYADLESDVERILCRYPIPVLQKVGGQVLPLLYDTSNWPEGASPPKSYRVAKRREKTVLDRSKQHEHAGFDNQIRFYADVEVMLATLAPLLTPLIRREWTNFVSRCNRELGEVDLQSFLFEPTREDLQPVRDPLRKYQEGLCFYCGKPLRRQIEVDHFLPWSRSTSNALENLVAAHRHCNNDKRDHLAGVLHLRRWKQRFESPTRLQPGLGVIAVEQSWTSDPSRTLRLARSMYLVQPRSHLLWVSPKEFEEASPEEVRIALEA